METRWNERVQAGEISRRPNLPELNSHAALPETRGSGTKASGSPVTPEVAGWAPVAPVREVPAKSAALFRLTKYLARPAAFKPCSSPVTYHGLVHDLYTFQVQAITSRGFVQPSATGYTFADQPTQP